MAAAVDRWHVSLNDIPGGSALWDLRTLGDALVDLTSAHPSGIAQLFAGRPTRLSNLVREGSALAQARRGIRVVAVRTEELGQRYGVAPTYVAMGVATWRTTLTDSGTPELAPALAPDASGSAAGAAPGATDSAAGHAAPADPDATQPMPLAPDAGTAPALPAEPESRVVRAPVLLRPVQLNVHGADSEITLELDPAVEINSVLIRDLKAHGVELDPAELAASTMGVLGFSPQVALDRLAAAASVLPEFQLDRRIVLGAFVHPGQALAEDLDQQREQLAGHDVVAALAGDETARERDTGRLPELRAEDRHPDQDVGIGDLDPTQQRVLDAVATGAHLLVDTPPGADVPTTAAAVIAQAVQAGQRVLYVPGTRRAAQGLMDRMRTLGVGEMALDLCGDTTWRSTAVQRVVDGLNPPEPEYDAGQLAADRAGLVNARTTLADFVRALHTSRQPWDASAYDALQALAGLTSQRPGPRTTVRLQGAVVTMDVHEREHAREELARAAALGAFRLRAADTPWFGAELTSAEHAVRTLGKVRELSELLPALIEQVEATAAQTGLDEAETFTVWSQHLTLLEGVRASLDVFTPQVLERSAADMAAATASRPVRQERAIDMGWAARQRLRRQAKDLLRPGVSVGDLHQELVTVQRLREQWRTHSSSGGWPHLPEGLRTSVRTSEEVGGLLDELNPVLSPTTGGQDLHDIPLADLSARLERLGADDAAVRQMPERAAVLSVLNSMGLAPLVQDLTSRRVPTALVGAEFELAWWSSVLEEVLATDPALAGLEAESLEEAAARMRRLERAHIEALSIAPRAALRRQVREAIESDRPRAQEFYRTAQQGLTDLKEAVTTFGEVARAPRPVWLVPPMVVPAVLPPGEQVDLLVLDAVQHLPTEHAISAIARSRQVVTFGDTRRGGNGLVAAMDWLPRLTLSSDRMDQDPEIAAFLAEHGYDDVIQPVPAPPRSAPITLELVHGTGMPAPDSDVVESVQAEVDKVVDLVIDHALTRPEESLAVVALNTRHADRVREAILSTARNSTALKQFFDPANNEAFTVVEVESAAGLHRDALIVTLGYGKTPHGRVLHRFGSVSGPHGAEYLIDVLDACRHRLTVVSCMVGADLDPERLRSRGAQMLRDVLQFAEDGAVPIPAPETTADSPDRLLVDLTERLRRLGLRVVPRYGRPGGVRIPLALGHPALPGELVLAVMTDDADYVAEPSLRRRDRHWVQRLENRGWQVRMVYSTAVFMDPQGIAERLAQEVTAAVAEKRGESVEQVPAPQVPHAVEDDDEALVTTNATLSAIRGEQIAGRLDTPTATRPPIAGVRAERPDVGAGRPLSDYGDDELDAVVAWIASDGQQHTQTELLEQLRSELGVTRRGSHVNAVLGAAVRRSGLAAPDPQESQAEESAAEDAGATSVEDAGATSTEAAADEEGPAPGPGSADDGGSAPGADSAEHADPAAEPEDTSDPGPPTADSPARPEAPADTAQAAPTATPAPDANGRDAVVDKHKDETDTTAESGRGAPSRRSRRSRRSMVPQRAWEDDPRAWGEGPEDDDDRLLREKPPHWS